MRHPTCRKPMVSMLVVATLCLRTLLRFTTRMVVAVALVALVVLALVGMAALVVLVVVVLLVLARGGVGRHEATGEGQADGACEDRIAMEAHDTPLGALVDVCSWRPWH